MKRTIRLALRLIISGFSAQLAAQSVSYNDVLVVINNASIISDSIGTYFADVRNIPVRNIVRVTAPTNEEIDSLQFEDLRQQIEYAIVSQNLRDSINYIVTTKGLPLKVKREAAYANSSVENELTLILGPYASYIGKAGKIPTPYYKKRDNFTRAKYGIYLVTRLDGYTYDDIKGLIDRSSVTPNSIPQVAQVVLDTDPTWTSIPILNRNMQYASDSLTAKGITSYLDTTTVFVTDKNNVLGYTSFGSNDRNCHLYATNAIPRNTYLPGAIAETYVSTSARSFATPPAYGQSLIADLIAEGITGAKGYVYEPYSNAMADVSVLFPMYVDGFTIAESFYSSSLFLSWMDVIIGDPKFRLTSKQISADSIPPQLEDTTELPIELTSFTATARKNNVTLNWKTASEENCYGFEVERRAIAVDRSVIAGWSTISFIRGSGTSNITQLYSYTDNNLAQGRYAYRLKQIDNDGSFNYYGNCEIDILRPDKKLTLEDNYPNPFNPSTTINFTVANDALTTLCVYNILGQKVTTLFNDMTSAGQTYRVKFDASTLPSGIYFARLESDNQLAVKRMVLTK